MIGAVSKKCSIMTHFLFYLRFYAFVNLGVAMMLWSNFMTLFYGYYFRTPTTY